MTYIVRCKVSGGYTGTRFGTLKQNGAIQVFQSQAEAQAEADRLNQRNDNPYRTCDFSYWTEESNG